MGRDADRAERRGPPAAAQPGRLTGLSSPDRPARPEELVISTRRRPPARPTGAPAPGAEPGEVPVVGGREPCPCGSGKRYKACHGRTTAPAFVARTFEALQDETEWIAMREILPSASAPLTVVGHEDRDVLLSTVLPMAWPGMVRSDGKVMVALQVVSRSGDPSRDVAQVLQLALDAEPGSSIVPTAIPTAGPRLEDLLVPGPLQLTLHDGYDHWLAGIVDEPTGEVAESMQRANDSVIPTRGLTSVRSAYWCRMAERSHLRWVLPEDEEPLLDALARVSLEAGLHLGEETRYVGSFRAHGRLVPVWDLPRELEPEALEEPAARLRGLLDEALGAPRELTPVERRARAGLLSRQLTLR